MGTTWSERQTGTPEDRRAYEQERLVVWATDRLAEAMEEAGVSKAELAARLGTSRAHVTALLSGSRNMTLRTLADVACVLGQRVEVVLEPLRHGDFVTTGARRTQTEAERPARKRASGGATSP